MKFYLGRDAGLTVEIHDTHVCQFGISEGLGALFGGDLLAGLGSLFGGSAAAAEGAGAAGLETGLATIGPGAVAADTGLAGITGTGAGLFGGTTGLTGTALAGGTGLAGDALIGTGAATAAGTAADYLAAPAASGFNADAVTAGALNDGIPTNATPTSATGNPFGPTPSATPGVANVGPATQAPISNITGVAGPAAPSAAVAPSGAGATDLTSAVPGAQGYSSLGGPGGPAPLTGGAAPSAGGLQGIVDNAISSVEKNPLSLVGPAAGLGGLAYTVSQANKGLPEQAALTSAAQTATQQGNQLSSYLLNGTLPAGLQTTLDKATADAKTAAISNAAKNGQPTNPSQNSTLAAELAQIDQQATISTAQIGQSLLTSGLSETQLAASDYSTLLSADQTEQNLISQSISNFAKSLGSLGSGGIKLNIGNSGVTATT